MNTILIAVMILLSVLITVATILFISLKFYNEKKREVKLQELSFYNEVYSDIESIDESIDVFIQMIFNNYQIFHSEFFLKEFITEDDQKKITIDVHKEVIDCMSPTLMSRMLLIYKAEKVQEVLNKKIMLLVIQAADQINTNPNINNKDISDILNR